MNDQQNIIKFPSGSKQTDFQNSPCPRIDSTCDQYQSGFEHGEEIFSKRRQVVTEKQWSHSIDHLPCGKKCIVDQRKLYPVVKRIVNDFARMSNGGNNHARIWQSHYTNPQKGSKFKPCSKGTVSRAIQFSIEVGLLVRENREEHIYKVGEQSKTYVAGPLLIELLEQSARQAVALATIDAKWKRLEEHGKTRDTTMVCKCCEREMSLLAFYLFDKKDSKLQGQVSPVCNSCYNRTNSKGRTLVDEWKRDVLRENNKLATEIDTANILQKRNEHKFVDLDALLVKLSEYEIKE
jgi:hypothetical protein